MVKLQAATVLARQQIPQAIEWPRWDVWQRERAMAQQTPEELVADAVRLIDSGFDRDIEQARETLERAIARDPKQDAAYIELARVAMKSNWGPEGLHQAESFLASARQINPANPNILLGYALAYALQRHELATARRLLKLGARPDLPVGRADMPLALAALVEGDAEAVHLLQHFGADYSKLSYQGVSAREIAKATGHSDLLELGGRVPVL